MTDAKTVLVTGATGKQGGAVAQQLLARGHKVRAFTRKADSAAAKALAAAGATIAVGSLDDAAAVDRALAGADAVFSMGTPFESGEAAETRQGVTVADAAKRAGAHLVYTSVGSADKATGIPHFDSKYAVEKHIHQIGAKATILAPVYFMENLMFARAQLKQGVYATPLTAGRKLAEVAVADIAGAAVSAIEQPARYVGKRFDLTSDELTADETIAILSRITGKTFTYFQMPMDMVRQAMGEDGVKMYEWFERVGYTVDPAAQKRDFPDVAWHSFEAWARALDWKAILEN